MFHRDLLLVSQYEFTTIEERAPRTLVIIGEPVVYSLWGLLSFEFFLKRHLKMRTMTRDGTKSQNARAKGTILGTINTNPAYLEGSFGFEPKRCSITTITADRVTPTMISKNGSIKPSPNTTLNIVKDNSPE